MSRRWLDSLFGETIYAPRLSRRELLHAGLAAASGYLLSANNSGSAETRGKGRKVIVVGAGFAGLACAHELASAGTEVVVLEARDRVGGRVESRRDMVAGKVVEAGGELLGANHPTVLAYAAQFQLEFVDVAHYSAKVPRAVVLNGRRLGPQELKSAYADSDRALKQLTELSRPVVVDQPWQTPDAKTLDQLSTAAWIRTLEISPLAKELVSAQLAANNSVPVEVQSQLGNLAQIAGGGHERYWSHSERYRCRGGNQQFAHKLAERVGAARLYLKAPVKAIATNRDTARVTTTVGDVYEADDVVLAVPPSTWSRIQFEPELPPELTPQMGWAVKFLTSVRERFWEQHDMHPGSMSYGGIGHTWVGTENQDRMNPREVLVSFISEHAARRWSQHPDENRIRDYLAALDALQPGASAASERTSFVDWLSQPFTSGGYSFPAPGQITSHGPIFHAGIERLHFAGEHTCYQFVGYMEGALRSGVNAAKRVLSSSN